MFIVEIFSPRIDISNEVLCASFTQTGPIVLEFHLLGLGFWMFRVFHYFLIINRPLRLIVTLFIGM